MKKKALFIDRDGTIINEPPDEQIDSLDKLEFLPGVIGALRQLAQEKDFELVMVTNQDGLGTAAFPEENFWPAHEKMLKTLAGEGIHFAAIHIDKTYEFEQAPTRKPGTAMLTDYLTGDYDLAHSYVIGDRLTDVQLGVNLGCQSILIGGKQDDRAVLCSSDWQVIQQFLSENAKKSVGISHLNRVGVVERSTKETDIRVVLNIDGDGRADLATGIGFFDHLLEQLVKHSGCDLLVRVQGDLHIDEHHSIEDTALALGQAYTQALGDKAGISRYGHFALPMDETLAEVALDFSGRPWLVWQAKFHRECVGGMPTEMFQHFFKSFSDTAKCNLNIRVTGENDHHQIEATFKAFARALKMAVQRTVGQGIPSTKGVL
jgi:imidazoleglycerol-phosphate dehydratase / histidinol-phosphatase